VSYYSPNALEREGSLARGAMTPVYAWMTAGLLTTGAIASYTATSEALLRLIFGNPFVLIGLIISQFAIVAGLSWALGRISAGVATALFLLYSALNGLTLSSIFIVYTSESIASTFFITAGTFALMSAYGYFTKRDLSSWGNLLFMALIGFLIASVVNIFLRSSALYWVITYAGVLIFVGLTAYDTQKIKRMAAAAGPNDLQKVAIFGALALYLDFINLFLMLLRILGGRRD
jgi:FtsH-binding integral membrane protein